MNEETKQGLIWSSALVATILGALLLITSCVRDELALYRAAASECVQRGGSMEPARGSSELYVCVLPK